MKKYLRGGVDAELQFALLAVVDGEALHEQRREAGTGTPAERVEHQKTLQNGG